MVAASDTDRIVMTLPPLVSSVPKAREFASAAMRELGGDEPAAERAKLLVSELATNVVLHARTPMRLSACRSHGHVRVEVRDDEPCLPEPVTTPADPYATSGRGMTLVGALSAAWGMNGNERGKTIWFEV
jgi:anti-sigma regulatory factor (Ser/Thr protein kinase)